MTNTHRVNKAVIKKPSAEKILATVPYTNGFHFFTVIGQYTGETANSLVHFAIEIEHIPIESVDFHFKRGDFQKWIADTIGDGELAGVVGRIERELSGEPLRKSILAVLNVTTGEKIKNPKTESFENMGKLPEEMQRFLVYAQKLVDPVETYNVQTHEVRVEGDKILVRV
jgi:hypothetical protein